MLSLEITDVRFRMYIGVLQMILKQDVTSTYTHIFFENWTARACKENKDMDRRINKKEYPTMNTDTMLIIINILGGENACLPCYCTPFKLYYCYIYIV